MRHASSGLCQQLIKHLVAPCNGNLTNTLHRNSIHPPPPLTSIFVSAALGALASACRPAWPMDRASSRALSKHCRASLCMPSAASRVLQEHRTAHGQHTHQLQRACPVLPAPALARTRRGAWKTASGSAACIGAQSRSRRPHWQAASHAVGGAGEGGAAARTCWRQRGCRMRAPRPRRSSG